jgi:hypothetical protein
MIQWEGRDTGALGSRGPRSSVLYLGDVLVVVVVVVLATGGGSSLINTADVKPCVPHSDVTGTVVGRDAIQGDAVGADDLGFLLSKWSSSATQPESTIVTNTRCAFAGGSESTVVSFTKPFVGERRVARANRLAAFCSASDEVQRYAAVRPLPAVPSMRDHDALC